MAKGHIPHVDSTSTSILNNEDLTASQIGLIMTKTYNFIEDAKADHFYSVIGSTEQLKIVMTNFFDNKCRSAAFIINQNDHWWSMFIQKRSNTEKKQYLSIGVFDSLSNISPNEEYVQTAVNVAEKKGFGYNIICNVMKKQQDGYSCGYHSILTCIFFLSYCQTHSPKNIVISLDSYSLDEYNNFFNKRKDEFNIIFQKYKANK